MIKTEQLKLVDGQPKIVYGTIDRKLELGDSIRFACSGRGRGGHYRVVAKITKLNQKTFQAVESTGSYKPGMLWAMPLSPTFLSTVYIILPSEVPERKVAI